MKTFDSPNHDPPTILERKHLKAQNTRSTSLEQQVPTVEAVACQPAITQTAAAPRVGSFEACFATELDLSEFGNGSERRKNSTTNKNTSIFSNGTGEGSGPTTSASFQLLQIKEKEALHNEYQQMEELRMQEVIRERKEQLMQCTKNKQNMDNSSPAQLMQQATQRSINVHSKKDSFMGALIGNIHHHNGGEDQVNQSRASRQMETQQRRMRRKHCSKLKQQQQQQRNHKSKQFPSSSPSKGKPPKRKEGHKVKY